MSEITDLKQQITEAREAVGRADAAVKEAQAAFREANQTFYALSSRLRELEQAGKAKKKAARLMKALSTIQDYVMFDMAFKNKEWNFNRMVPWGEGYRCQGRFVRREAVEKLEAQGLITREVGPVNHLTGHEPGWRSYLITDSGMDYARRTIKAYAVSLGKTVETYKTVWPKLDIEW